MTNEFLAGSSTFSLDGERLPCSVDAILDSFGRSYRCPPKKGWTSPGRALKNGTGGDSIMALALERGRQFIVTKAMLGNSGGGKKSAPRRLLATAATHPAPVRRERWCDDGASVFTMGLDTVYIDENDEVEDGTDYTEVTASTCSGDASGTRKMQARMEREYSLFEASRRSGPVSVDEPDGGFGEIRATTADDLALSHGITVSMDESDSGFGEFQATKTDTLAEMEMEVGDQEDEEDKDDASAEESLYTEVVEYTSASADESPTEQSGGLTTLVDARVLDDSSLYTEETVESSIVPTSHCSSDENSLAGLIKGNEIAQCPAENQTQGSTVSSVTTPEICEIRNDQRRLSGTCTIDQEVTVRTRISQPIASPCREASRRPQMHRRSMPFDELTMDLLLQPRLSKGLKTTPRHTLRKVCEVVSRPPEPVEPTKPSCLKTGRTTQETQLPPAPEGGHPATPPVPENPALIYVFPSIGEDASVLSGLTRDVSQVYANSHAMDLAILEAMSRPIPSQPQGYHWLSRFWGAQ